MAEIQELSPFLRCPLEIRLSIYRLLLVGGTAAVDSQKNIASLPDYYEYEKAPGRENIVQNRVLSFRNVGMQHFDAKIHESKRRSTYKIRSDRFRARCIDTTYTCVNVPDICTNILAVNKQIHEEATRLLYTSYTFDFDSHIEACAPFLSDLTPYSRAFIRRLSVVKKNLTLDKDFDRCEWSIMCKAISENLNLTTLSLGVVTGKPLIGWDMFEQIPETEFHPLVTKHKRDEMQWVRDLSSIKGLQNLDIRPCIEHSPPPVSDAMMFFVAFSASVGTGFSDYLQKQMICLPSVVV